MIEKTGVKNPLGDCDVCGKELNEEMDVCDICAKYFCGECSNKLLDIGDHRVCAECATGKQG